MNVSFFQPVLTSYRLPLFNAIAELPNVSFTLYSSVSRSDHGLSLDDSVHRIFNWNIDKDNNMRRLNIACLKMSLKAVRESDVIVHFADFKFPSLFLCMFFCFFSKTKFFLHGQGGYKRSGLLHKIVYNLSLCFCDGYVCYSQFSKKNLENVVVGSLHKKISVADNFLYVEGREVKVKGKDVLYIGRLRDGCGIELLLQSALIVGLKVRVIGGGDEIFIKKLIQTYENLVYYGAIFDESEQFSVAEGCFVGAYGGDAGLSVVHYMAYGLPVVIHDDLYKHMGPEPSYIVERENGLTFKRGDIVSLSQVLNELKDDVELQHKLSSGAFYTFLKLQNPPMHEKFAKILGIS